MKDMLALKLGNSPNMMLLSNLVDLPPFFGALVGKSLVNQRHDFVEHLAG